VVFDTSIEDTPDDYYDDKPPRPWRKGDNPKIAVRDFLQVNDRFVVDEDMESKLLVTVCPEGYLRCVKD
jgi:cephalosporin hydroxylase